MLKTLEIKNFKSIGHAKLDFGKINVLTGQSNLGKSNVVQAIYCLVHNHWDSNYLKWGEKKCSIRLTDENDEWVEYSHGSDSSAEYRLSTVEVPFTKIGRDVPVPVKDFLKMNEVQFDEDLSLDFNFERQFDPSFVISLSGFELAKVFGKLMNLDIVLSASRNINKDLAASKKQVDGQEAIENVSIEYINSHYPIELKYALLHQAIQLDANAEDLDRKNTELLSLLTDLEYYQNALSVYSKFLDSEDNKQIDEIREPVYGLEDVLASLIYSSEVYERYSKASDIEIPDFDFDLVNGLFNGIVQIEECVGKNQVYSDLITKLDGSVTFDIVDTIVSNKNLIDSVDQWNVEFTNDCSMIANSDVAIQQKTLDFNTFLKENNICPISGKPFMDGCIESIVANV